MSGTEREDHYYLTTDWLPTWVECTKAEYVKAEREAGFRPTYGRSWDEPATAGFSGGGVSGSLSYGKRRGTLEKESYQDER